VRRSALPVQAQDEKASDDNSEIVEGGRPGDSRHTGTGDSTKVHPRRFVGSITLDPDRAGLQVAKIADEILFELTRSNGSTLKLTLEIEAAAATGYPDDVVDVVRSNIRDLKLDASKVGFEDE